MKFRIAVTVILALALVACGKKEDAVKPATAGTTSAATTPATLPAGTAPGATAQPASAAPGTGQPAASSVVPRNLALGTAVGPNKKVTAITDKMTAKDTAYVSVDLYGAGDAKVSASWTLAGKPLKSDTQTVKVSAPVTVGFNLAGLAPGDHDVELMVNDVSAGKQKFTVK